MMRWTNCESERSTLAALLGTIGLCLMVLGMLLGGLVKALRWWRPWT